MIGLLVLENDLAQKLTKEDGRDSAKLASEDIRHWQEIARSYRSDLREQLGQPGIEARTRTTSRRPVKEIIKVAHHDQVHLLAIASHARGALAQMMCGSVTSAVLERVNPPLLMIW